MPKRIIQICHEFINGLVIFTTLLFLGMIESNEVNLVRAIPFNVTLTLVLIIVFKTHWYLYHQIYKQRNYLLYIGGTFGLGILMWLIIVCFHMTLYPLPPSYYTVFFVKNFLRVGGYCVFSFAMMIVVTFAQESHNRSQSQETHALHLDAELKLLRSQINPHFLFNTLHTLYSLIVTKSDKTENMVLMLAEIMRYSYQTTDNDLVPMKNEFDHLQSFITLQQIRLGNRAVVTFIVEGENIHEWTIAPLLFFTFVENAFKHGIEEQPQGWLFFLLQVEKDTWRLTVKNSKPNSVHKSTLPENGQVGRGLANARRRLHLLYPDRHRFIVENLAGEFIVFLEVWNTI